MSEIGFPHQNSLFCCCGNDFCGSRMSQEKDITLEDIAQIEGTSADPLMTLPSHLIREGDFVILSFADGKQVFAECLKKNKGKANPVKINKRSYSTAGLIGLPYGSVLELGPKGLVPLPDSEDLIPELPGINDQGESRKDNRNLVDDNTSQALDMDTLKRMREEGTEGSVIVERIIQNSKTFGEKTDFSKAKYITRKQMKYQPRCRLVRCTGATICELLYKKDTKRMMSFREDTLAQILSYANISAGCQTIVYDGLQGLVTGAMAQRMGGYGKIFTIYEGQQPSFLDLLSKFNLSFAESSSIKYLHAGDIFGVDEDDSDPEKRERDECQWPCPLQEHTREYLTTNVRDEKDQRAFLAKRSARFTRKLTRHSPGEAKTWVNARKSDSVVIVTRYDPAETLLGLMPFLASSCPFVVFCEFIEPLTECFKVLQEKGLAINLRLSDTWTREYQILLGRTHPNMNMSQSGGFILTGVKLDEIHGHNDLDEDLLKEIREEVGGLRRRNGRKPRNAIKLLDDDECSKEKPPSKKQKLTNAI